MISVRSLFSLLLLAAALAARAQSTVPVATQALPARTLGLGEAAATIDLRDYFGVPGITGQVVQFDTVLGKFNVMLRADVAPKHVANFLAYVQAGSYRNSFFHRSANLDPVGAGGNSIVQGGGFRTPLVTTITTFANVPLEYNLPNAVGTLAAARTADINSATSQWYFNVRDNSTTLGLANGGGYTVFGQVIGTGMSIVNAIAALPKVNAGGAFTDLPVRNLVGTNVTDANLALVNSISPLQTYPGAGTSLILFAVQNSASNVVTAAITGTTLSLAPLSGGTADVTVTATDVSGNPASSTFTVTVSTSAAPVFTTQPTSQAAAPGGSATLTTAASGAAPGAFQWQRNGTVVTDATDAVLTIPSLPANTGIYLVQATTASGTALSNAAILGVNSTVKLVGPGQEFTDIFHSGTGFTYDQILLGGAAASMKADSELGQILRVSFIDLNDDIVQVEFSGPGTLSLVLDAAAGPALPTKYVQNTSYMKGHAGIVLTGANVNTNLTVFSVGRANAVNQALFRSDVTYDGVADIAFIAITSTDGKFGGLRAANASMFAAKGYTGVYAPGVQFTGPTFVGDINAGGEATPVLILGSSTDVRITGGDLLQNNNRAVQVSGITQLKFTAGSNSHGTTFPAQANQARLEQNGVDVTSQIVVNP